MESSITKLDGRTDNATKKMLQSVVDRKRKFDKFKSRHETVMWMTIAMTSCYFVYLYINVAKPFYYSFSEMFSVFVQNSSNLYFLVVIGGSYGLMNLLREKREKAEKEYHALRCEIIDKSKDLWKKEDEWKNRHVVFEMMKKNYDINLFHENK
ncbi:YpbF family protein [Bacillus sp. T33-2]|uniref:YpbF family protein n=1 Tax=Bacillus sp. T33-2 TaxID=2054168 RepID=UPI000C791D53|nr:YpbF family protein [Bacillus sp. T33-2]PLR99779.1 DUF2663 domain-containing protein [Bacillus sp. T33-2]